MLPDPVAISDIRKPLNGFVCPDEREPRLHAGASADPHDTTPIPARNSMPSSRPPWQKKPQRAQPESYNPHS
jgi:hypothetical protein